MRKLGVALAVVGLVVAFGAAPSAAGEGNLKKFCRTAVAVDQAEDGPTRKQLKRYRNTAPPEIAESVDQAVTTFQEEGDDAFEDEAFVALLAEINQFVLDNCDFEQVTVRMQDYSFEGIPEVLEQGTVAFSLLNEGEELHEIHFHRLEGDATLDDILSLDHDAAEEEINEIAPEIRGTGFAFPGDTDLALVTFKEPGTYVALCSIPVGTTPEAAESDEAAGGEPHYVEGMAAVFEVTS